jgi:CubicO group peptidase (beta-lactamase class C family)
MRITPCLLGVALTLVPGGIRAGEPTAARPSDAVGGGCSGQLFGAWTGVLPAAALLELNFAITETESGSYRAEISSGQQAEALPLWESGRYLDLQSARFPVAFRGVKTDSGNAVTGFLTHAATLERLTLPVTSPSARRRAATWTPLGVPIREARLDLYIEDEGGGTTGGYFFFRDQRLPGLYGFGMTCEGGAFTLRERSLGLRFEARLAVDSGETDRLQARVTGLAGAVPMTFTRLSEPGAGSGPTPAAPARAVGSETYRESAPRESADGWPVGSPSKAGLDLSRIHDLVADVVSGELALTHSVLVAVNGRLVIEEYFYGFDGDTWHDLRSASKTLTSTLVVLAIQEGHIDSVEARALDYFPDYRRYRSWDPRKAEITIGDLLAMSSGLDANDSDPASFASEGAYQSQTSQPDWTRFVLDAPMIGDPGAQPLYGSANPLILGAVLHRALPESVEWFAERALFGALGIARYRFALDPVGIPYMGGGLYLRPRDMLKFGQLYLDGGRWRGRSVLAEDWVRASWASRGRLAPLERNGNLYGYLWWHQDYRVGGRVLRSLEARGYGGQYISVVPELKLVTAITSGHYRTGKTRQPQDIIERYILPAALSTR